MFNYIINNKGVQMKCPRPTITCDYKYPNILDECTTAFCQKAFDEINDNLKTIVSMFGHINKPAENVAISSASTEPQIKITHPPINPQYKAKKKRGHQSRVG